ncbi:hypothetical protein [Variovorax sp. HJSM1_2]|uniref:hypothetical protein n=1 Tax=Variovorax sp. HJSM1_2 TaxID=3366263 RepID=UPI003BB9C71D
MSVRKPNPAVDVIEASLMAALTTRHVQRSLLADPGNAPLERLQAGVVCLVVSGGGNFANYRGREGDLGTLQLNLVGFLKVADDTEPEAIEQAELALLGELLDWVHEHAQLPGVDSVTPGNWQQSKQLEHPYGWLTLGLDVKY